MQATSILAGKGGSSLFARWREWRNNRRKQREEAERRWEEDQRLMPLRCDDRLMLPITGDCVFISQMQGVAVRDINLRHEVVISTRAQEYIVPCANREEAELVRYYIVHACGLIKTAWDY